MGEPGSDTRSGANGGRSGGQSDDLRHFIGIDQQIFERLNQGDPRPFRLTLRDGRKITGEPKGIARGTGLTEEMANHCWGHVLIATAEGDIELSYLDIAEVA